MGDRRLNRRGFLKYGALATVGSYAALTTEVASAKHGGCGGGCVGSGVIDPPVGGLFTDPVDLPLTRVGDGIASGVIEPMVSRVPINGSFVDLMTYNGTFPGPAVRLARGEKFALKFVNSLPGGSRNILGYERGMTNIHTHGWHVSPAGTNDDVMRHFMPGESGDYLYDTKLQAAGTLCWYHPHIHGLTAEQVWGGLHGPLIIDDETDLLTGYETHVMVLKDITVSGGGPAPYSSTMEYMHGKEGDTVMVNGVVNPALTMRPGQVQRWRFLNASQARFYKLALRSHSLRVIGTDGGLLDQPYSQPYVVLSPGERLDVLVKATTTTGTYKLSSLPYARRGNMASAQVTLLTVNVTGRETNDAVPDVIDSTAARLKEDLSMWPRRTMALSMGMGRGYINGQDFDVKPFTIHSDVMDMMDMFEVWTITNQSGMDHPWHQHTNPAQVLAISGGDSAYTALYTQTPAWKDVVIIPKWGSATLLVKIADFTGMAMFHCHILEHEDIGMMGIWNLGEMPM